MFFHLNDRERHVVILGCVLIVAGAMTNAVLTRAPQIKRRLHFIDHPASIPKVNLNTATAQQLEALPYIGPATSSRILEYRRRNGKFRYVDEIRTLKGYRPENFVRFRDYLEVRP